MLHVEEIRPLRMPESPHHRLVTIGIVVGIHVVAISAFLMLRPPASQHDNGPLVIDFIADRTRPLPVPPPPTVTLKNPALPTADQPKVDVTKDTPDPGPITVVRGDPAPVNPPVLSFGPRALMGTHTIPDYPPIDARLGHEGTVMLKLAIDERGVVTDAVVERSSGYGSLDQAAVNWVKAHWLYYPATHSGDTITSSADVTVTFRLSGHN